MSGIRVNYYGRTGNHILMYLMAQYIANKYDLVFDLKFDGYEELNELFDVSVYSGKKIHSTEYEVTDENVIQFLDQTEIEQNIALNGFFQSPLILGNSNIKQNYKKYIRPKTIQTDHDLYVHIRLGDILGRHSLPYEYYRESILKVKFSSGIISSDTPDHFIVQKLVEEFNLDILSASPISSIHYGSQCSNMVLSAGTFSFLSAFFSNNSNVFYIDNTTMFQKFGINAWGPDIFSIFNKQINFNSYEN